MEHTLNITYQLTGTPITFCYGNKAYKQSVLRYFKMKDTLGKGDCGVSTFHIIKNKGRIIIGVRKIKDSKTLNKVTVHEISHAVSQIMENYGLECDEVRSYSIEFLYSEIMEFLDDIRRMD